MGKEIVRTDRAPAAIGPYSQAVKAGGFVFASGQLGIDPSTGKLVDDVEAQTRQALLNLSAVFEAAGTNLDNVVKTTIFLADIADFPKVNGVYGEFFGSSLPARATVQVAALPLGALVEIEAIATA